MGKNGLSTVQDKSTKRVQLVLFILVAGGMFLWLFSLGDMASVSRDAADIWKTITSYYSEDRYYSYVMYKGFASVYPYVWFYQLAVLLHLNDFFFVMLYHAVLFAYLVVVGIPAMVRHFTKTPPRLWQRVLLIVLLFWIWVRTLALSELMVDLPSCAYFILAVNGALRIQRLQGRRKFLNLFYTGALCGLCANISGQYSIAALCVIVYAVIQCVSAEGRKQFRRKAAPLLAVVLILLGSFGAKGANLLFEAKVIEPYRMQGNHMADGSFWMGRGLIYMMDKSRLFSGPQIADTRGMAILEDRYGAQETQSMMEQAERGVYAWSIKDYFATVVHYPQEFLPRFIDRAFICVSTDLSHNSLTGLAVGYTALYLALFTAVKGIKKVKQFFSAKLWIVLGAVGSIIPCIVMTVEMRYALSLQALIFGVALLGPVLPQLGKSVADGIREIRAEKSLRILGDKQFPWAVAIWAVFVLCCITHMADLYAQSGWGTDMLFSFF